MQPHMTKIAQKFAKNRKKLLSLEGGSSKTPHGFLGGVGQKTMSVHKGGRGGQKCPKFRPHGLWMTPNWIQDCVSYKNFHFWNITK